MNYLCLAALFVAQGIAYAIMKSFERLRLPEYKPLMLAGLFGAALVITLAVFLFKLRRPCAKDIFHGIATGICNAFSNGFLIVALSLAAASVIFPTFTIGTIIVVTLSSILLWRERYSRRVWLGLALAIISIAIITAAR